MLTLVQNLTALTGGFITNREYKPADKKSVGRLDMLREELDIPWKELNKIAKEVVGREFGDVRNLTETENRKVRIYLKVNGAVLGERYRKIKWSKQS